MDNLLYVGPDTCTHYGPITSLLFAVHKPWESKVIEKSMQRLQVCVRVPIQGRQIYSNIMIYTHNFGIDLYQLFYAVRTLAMLY